MGCTKSKGGGHKGELHSHSAPEILLQICKKVKWIDQIASGKLFVYKDPSL
jgi:hypothetical protein